MACAADAVVAQPGTLTGSIGVIIGKYVVSDLLSKIGVSHTAISARDTNIKVISDMEDGSERSESAVSSQADMLMSDPQQPIHPDEEDQALIPYRTLRLIMNASS